MKYSWLKRPIVALLTVPAFICLAIGLLPLLVVWAEHQFAKGTLSPYVIQIGPDSARTLLSTVAAGSMTALSLAYSMVLLVFTLAAGNIGPRLLKRFTSDLVNQITAGIFGGTFLYALMTILFVSDGFVPKVAITIAGALAVLSVMQLIYFVRHVSRSVTIDEEIADITANLREALKAKFNDREEPENDEFKGEYEHEITSPLSGYVGAINAAKLASCASKGDFVLSLEVPQGGYVIKGERLLQSDKQLDEDAVEQCLGFIAIDNARSPENEIDFSTNLLVEIALRALSPGVNDTFTALAAVNSLSGALSEVVENDRKAEICVDDDGKVRFTEPGFSPARLVDQAFSPIRRASASNILMAEGIARALARLQASAGKEVKAEIGNQTKLLFDELSRSGHSDDDLERVAEFLPEDLKARFA